MNNHAIENEHQYEVTKHWVGRFKESLAELETHRKEITNLHENAALFNTIVAESYESMIEDLEGRLKEYKERHK